MLAPSRFSLSALFPDVKVMHNASLGQIHYNTSLSEFMLYCSNWSMKNMFIQIQLYSGKLSSDAIDCNTLTVLFSIHPYNAEIFLYKLRIFQFEILSSYNLFVSFQYQCYGSSTIIILSVRGPSLDIRI